MNRGYVRFDSLYRHFHLNNAFFVTRAKENMPYEVIDSREADRSAGLFSDETIRLTGPLTSKKYPDALRLVIAKKHYMLNPSLHSISNSIVQVLFKIGDIKDIFN